MTREQTTAGCLADALEYLLEAARKNVHDLRDQLKQADARIAELEETNMNAEVETLKRHWIEDDSDPRPTMTNECQQYGDGGCLEQAVCGVCSQNLLRLHARIVELEETNLNNVISKDARIAELEAEKEAATGAAKQLVAELREADARIAELEAEVETLKRHWIEDDRDLKELVEQNESLTKRIAELEATK